MPFPGYILNSLLFDGITPVDIKENVVNAVQIFRDQQQNSLVNLQLNIDDKIPKILLGDSVRLHQILSNLVNPVILDFGTKQEIFQVIRTFIIFPHAHILQ